MAYQYVLFDLDGTLLDTSAGIEKAVVHTLKECGLPNLKPEIIKTFVGPPINRSLQETFFLNEEDTIKATNIFRTLYKEKYLYDATVYDGIRECLCELNKAGLSLGVATYKRDDYAHQIIHHFSLDQYFQMIQGCDMESKWSKEDIVKILLEKMKCTCNDEVVLIGDTENDYLGAKKCNIHFLPVSYGFGYKNDDVVDGIVPCQNPSEIISRIIES